MRLRIEIELGNDAMQTGVEAALSIQDALIKRATYPIFDPMAEGQHGLIRDGNGNTVGRWEVVGAISAGWSTPPVPPHREAL